MGNVIIAVHGFLEITNSKHQITNKSQITNINDLNDLGNFNIDGDWADPGEQILTDEWLDPNTSKNLSFNVSPVTQEQKSGTTFARFRISSQHGLS